MAKKAKPINTSNMKRLLHLHAEIDSVETSLIVAWTKEAWGLNQ
jgi:hypothetical protein